MSESPYVRCKYCSWLFLSDGPRRTVCDRCRTARNRTKRHRITPQILEDISRRQGNLCPCCGVGFKPGDATAIDHDHACCPGETSCGRCIRGILHRKCNSGLGLFGDDWRRLRRASDYLRQWAETTSIKVSASPDASRQRQIDRNAA
jgi:hypothetical protein